MSSGALARLFPPAVRCVETDPRSLRYTPHPEERALIRRAVPKRTREFSAGRWCARSALEQLGVVGFPLLADENRAPIWPAGITGSISHTEDYCAAVACRSDAIAGIGLDVEPKDGLPRDVRRRVLTSDELAWIESAPTHEADLLGKIVFSAKECVYKCQYAVTRAWLDFHDLEIELPDDRSGFVATVRKDGIAALPPGTRLRGRIELDSRHVFCGMTLSPRFEGVDARRG
jgi:4'-phosphopantetheinyl transferase EntD